ncbi:Gamma-interferon-inducible lysosomal thiol reductase [Sarcoptes scabiei]|nr:Gamma-interferon-inducible lysosomal thiol reductase [Sarcoptes scabiei]
MIRSKLFVSLLMIFSTAITSIHCHHTVTQISLYYESICPDSRKFFLNQLYPTYEKLNRFMDVELVPFGNANVSYPRHDNKPVFHCQHGPNECHGNRIQACVIEMVRNTDTSLRFVHCMFQQSDWKDTSATARRCAQSMQLDWSKIEQCANGDEGERLLIAYSLKTFNLNPEHTYVPWIVIDKNHTTTMQSRAESGLLRYLCEEYFNHEPRIEQCKIDQFQSQEQRYNGGSSLHSTNSSMINLREIILLLAILVINSSTPFMVIH